MFSLFIQKYVYEILKYTYDSSCIYILYNIYYIFILYISYVFYKEQNIKVFHQIPSL